MVDVRELSEVRARNPQAIAKAYADRARRPFVGEDGRLMIIAADHPARAALRVGDQPMAMRDREGLLDRLLTALGRPGVDGVLAAPDIVEDLLLLGALDGKIVIGSMNRGGLPGSAFEIDDRFTAYDANSLADNGLDAGKMLLRIDPHDRASATMLERSAQAVSELARRGMVALVEPFVSRRKAGRLENNLSADAVVNATVIASALGTTSAYTWLKLPVVEEVGGMERVASATTMPIVLLGGDLTDDPERSYARWERALAIPNVRGLTVGRSLLYPADGDVAAAVDRAVSLLPGRGSHARKG